MLQNYSANSAKKLRIRAFRAVDNPLLSHSYAEGHLNILKSVGVTEVTSAKLDWMTNPGVFVILVESIDTGKVLGGARIHLSNKGNNLPLPIEGAVKPLDEKICDLVHNDSLLGTGELCGLWNSREVAGMGIGSVFLTRASVSILNQLKIESLYGLAASYTLNMSLGVGYEIITDLGNNGSFYYPKTDFVAYALKIYDIKGLPKAKNDERDYIFMLRETPMISSKELSKGKVVEIEYQLEIEKNNEYVIS